MNNSECAKKVLDWAIREAMITSSESLKERCAEEARQTAEKTWKEYNPDDGVGGFGCNPYAQKDYLIKQRERIDKRNAEAQDVLEFVKTQICKMLDKY